MELHVARNCQFLTRRPSHRYLFGRSDALRNGIRCQGVLWRARNAEAAHHRRTSETGGGGEPEGTARAGSHHHASNAPRPPTAISDCCRSSEGTAVVGGQSLTRKEAPARTAGEA